MSENDKEKISKKKEKSSTVIIQPTDEQMRQLNPHSPKEDVLKALDSLDAPLASLTNSINSLEYEPDRAFLFQIALNVMLRYTWLTGYTKIGVLGVVKESFFKMLQSSQRHAIQKHAMNTAREVAEKKEAEMKKNPYIT